MIFIKGLRKKVDFTGDTGRYYIKKGKKAEILSKKRLFAGFLVIGLAYILVCSLLNPASWSSELRNISVSGLLAKDFLLSFIINSASVVTNSSFNFPTSQFKISFATKGNLCPNFWSSSTGSFVM